MRKWQLQEAKARLSQLVRSTQKQGPQEISVHGKAAAVLVSKKDYDRLARRKPSLVAFLRKSPLVGLELEMERDRSPDRDVSL